MLQIFLQGKLVEGCATQAVLLSYFGCTGHFTKHISEFCPKI